MSKKYAYAKSIRLQQDVLEYIEACPGEGFSEKFHNAIRACRDSEQERLKRLQRYDELIDKRKNQVKEISKDVGMLNDRVSRIRNNIDTIVMERNYYS